MKVLTIAEWQPTLPRTAREAAALRRLRGKAEKAVDRLIALLDELAADPDLEDGADAELEEDDQGLGSTHGLNQERTWNPRQAGWCRFVDEGEPTLATTPAEEARGFYAASPVDDREEDYEREFEHEGGDEERR